MEAAPQPAADPLDASIESALATAEAIEESPPVSESSEPITLADEPAAPARPYRQPELVTDEMLAALAAAQLAAMNEPEPPQGVKEAPVVLEDDSVRIRLVDGKIMVERKDSAGQLASNAPQTAPPAPLSARALTKRDAEMEAGRAAVARAKENERFRPIIRPSAAEIAAQGSNTAVFRPGDHIQMGALLARLKAQAPQG